MNNPKLWKGIRHSMLLIYAIGLYVMFAEGADNLFVLLIAFVLLVHALEIPMAVKQLQDKKIPLSTISVKTILYGFTWWLPVKKGIDIEPSAGQ